MASINVFFNLFIVLLALSSSANAQGLKVGFYRKTCPRAEAIILEEMRRVLSLAPTLGAPFLRLHFHDCFVRGCDASILLNSKNKTAEKDGFPNLSLRGYGVIDGIKSKLEKACPGVVSCADILALVARDAVYLRNGPFWFVPTGRRDGQVSIAAETFIELPPPSANIIQLKNDFAKKGLSVKDLVVLSGAHTIGTSHCASFSPRLYNFTGKGDADPSLDGKYVARLKSKCKPNDITTLAEMDPGSFKTFDGSYYKLVAKRRGLFSSDEALLHDTETKAYVLRQAVAGTSLEFFNDFGKSMVRMGNIGVLTGKQGEIRKHCAFVN